MTFGGRDRARALRYPFAEYASDQGWNMATHHEVKHHTVGEMDVREQQKTFSGFLKMAQWVVIVSIVILIFMALANG